MNSLAHIIRDKLMNFINKVDSDDHNILIAYLFGSALNKKLETASDIDLAFLLKSHEYQRDPIHTSYPAHRFASDIGLKYNKKTDVAILNSSSLEMSYAIVKNGRCIYECDADTRFEYEAKIRGMYFDFQPFLRDLRSRQIESIMRKKPIEIDR